MQLPAQGAFRFPRAWAPGDDLNDFLGCMTFHQTRAFFPLARMRMRRFRLPCVSCHLTGFLLLCQCRKSAQSRPRAGRRSARRSKARRPGGAANAVFTLYARHALGNDFPLTSMSKRKDILKNRMNMVNRGGGESPGRPIGNTRKSTRYATIMQKRMACPTQYSINKDPGADLKQISCAFTLQRRGYLFQHKQRHGERSPPRLMPPVILFPSVSQSSPIGMAFSCSTNWLP